MKPEITLVYDADCPNLPAARVALREALKREGLEPQWVEYDAAARSCSASMPPMCMNMIFGESQTK